MKYKVKVGSLNFEQGTFQAGDVIDVSEDRAKQFDQLDIELLGKTIVVTPTLNTVKTVPVNIQDTPVKPTTETIVSAPVENHSPVVGRKRKK
jgi:hypothetical protein